MSQNSTEAARARLTPYWLTAAHFGVGLGSLAAAALLLTTAVDDIAAARFLQPRMVAITHLLTLGWLTISIMGALCQILPGILAAPLRWVRLEAAALTLFVPGLITFVAGLLSSRTPLIVIGASTFATALVLFLINAVATVWRSKRRDLTWWTLMTAFGFLAATITFGISLAINLRNGHLAEHRLQSLAVHVHVALGGWVMLVVMAVGRRLLPAFLLSHGRNELPLRIAIAAMMTGVLALTVLHGFMTTTLFTIATLLMAVGMFAMAVQMLSYVRTRHRVHLDAGLRMVMAGGVLLMVAVALGLTILAVGSSARLITTYGTAAVGGLSLFVAGHYYKVLPLLIRSQRFVSVAARPPLRKSGDYSQRIASIAGSASTLGMYGIVGGAFMQSRTVLTIATLLLMMGVTIQAVHLLRLLVSKPA